MTNNAWQIWQNTPFSWWQCQLNFALWFASASCGVLFEDHLQAEKHTYTASTSNIRQGALLKRWVPPSKGINLIYGTRMHMTPKPISGFALNSVCHQTQTGGRRWTHGCQGLGSWSTFMTPPGSYRHAHTAQVLSLIQKPGQRLFLTNQRASCKRVWSILWTRSAHMFGQS